MDVTRTIETVFNCRTGVVHAKHDTFHDELTACGHYFKDFPKFLERYEPRGKVSCGTCIKSLNFIMPRPKFKLPATPKIAVDAIIHVFDKIVLIKRKFPPLGYAFPGGFMDIGETCEQAVVREAKEETGLICEVSGVLGVYSDPIRDKRGHVVSITYILTAPKGSIPVAADDAKEAFLTTPHDACQKVLVADHKQMLIDFYHKYWDKWTTVRE